jgi:PAS domain S-box-containing protein
MRLLAGRTMHERYRVALLILIMTGVVFGVGAVLFVVLYTASLNQQRERLSEIANTQARLIEAIARSDQANYGLTHTSEETFAYSLGQVREAQSNIKGLGKTGEFTLAQFQDNHIVYLMTSRHFDPTHPAIISLYSKLAQPMRRALNGETGTMTGLDYRGVKVLAAYEPVGIYDLGIVAKIDLTEIRAPFIRAGLIAGALALALVTVGTLLFWRITTPLLRRLEENEARYRAVFERAADGILLIDPQTAQIVEFNDRACELLGYTRDEFQRLKLSDLEVQDAPEELATNIAQIVREGAITLDDRHRAKNGEVREMIVNSRAVTFHGQQYILSIWHDITERKRLEDQFRAHATLLMSVSDAIISTDPNLVIETWNPAAEAIYGWRAHEVIGKPMDEVIVVTYPNQSRADVLRQFFEAGVWRGEAIHTRRDGTIINVLSSAVLLKDKDGKPQTVIAAHHDITIRKRSEEALRRQNEVLIALQETTLDLVSQLDLDHLLHNVVRRAGQLVGTSSGFLDLVGTDTGQLMPKVGLGALEASLRFPVRSGVGLSGTIWQTRQPLVIDDYDTWPGRIADYPLHMIGAIMGVPLESGGHVLGVLGVAYDAATAADRKFDPESVDLLSQLARLAAIAIDNVQLFAVAEQELIERTHAEMAERGQRTLAEALRDTAAVLTGTLNLEEVLDRILENIERVVPHDAANVLLIENGIGHSVRERGHQAQGTAEWIGRYRFVVAEIPTMRHVAETGQPLVLSDTANSTLWTQLEDKTQWIRSYVSAPIRMEGRVIGFLTLDSATPGFFTAQHAEQLGAFADQAALALHNAQLYDQVTSHAADMEQRVARRTAQYRKAQEHAETILNSSSDMIVILNNAGIIQQVNPIFDETFRTTPNESIGQPITILATPDSAPLLQRALAGAVKMQQPQRLEIEVLYKDCTLFHADVAISPIVHDHQLDGLVCSLRDISLLKQTELSLRRMLDKETELSEMRSRFITTTSHEFRTPLAIIQMSADMVERYGERLPEDRRQKEFEQIRSSVLNMVTLLDDILTISRAERGELDFQPEPLNLPHLCGELMNIFAISNGKSHRFSFSTSGDSPMFLADFKLLRYMVNNLLSNAIKYSPPDTIITLSVVCESHQAVLHITDEGIGIPEDERRELFQPFFRASNVGEVHGTGLGLAIVKQSVDMHGGTIEVESVEGHGTTFTITLPRDITDERRALASAADRT